MSVVTVIRLRYEFSVKSLFTSPGFVSCHEQHSPTTWIKRKRDAPSGTAVQLHKIVAEELGHEVPVASTRAGYIPGTHRLGFDSAADRITLTHEARSREGFAAGALVAARWIVGRKGVFEFSEVFDEIVTPRRHRDTEK